uniref:Uncharacterized protein n=1 Tax=Meloidogyne javanica TaxID=6303 RepID=A0A915LZ23_MELJA
MSHLIQTRGLMRSSTSTSNLQQIVVMIQSNGSALQLFDSQSICTLLLLYLLDQDKFNIVRLQDYQLWVSFSSNITSKTLKRLSPTNKLGRISSQVEMTTLEAETEKQLLLRLQQQIAQLTDQIQTKHETTTNVK